jgi:hypothetical protein
MSDTPQDYAVRLKDWADECERVRAQRAGYAACLRETTSFSVSVAFALADRALPLPPRPESPKVPRVVVIVTDNFRQYYRVVNGRVENSLGNAVNWSLNGWTLADFALVASLAQRPYEGDPEPATLTREWCYNQIFRVAPGILGQVNSIELLAFARAVLTEFGGSK